MCLQLYNICGSKKGGEIVAPKKAGRPPSDNPKDKTLRVRVDDHTLEKIDQCTQALHTTRSDIVRQGIDKVYDDLKK